MHVIIVGCGRVGASTAAELARAGHEVVVIDRNPDAFRLLPTNFGGRTIVGTGFDRDVIESAGIREADALVAATGGDNTNAVAARIAKEVYRVPDVVARIFDPRRADIYRHYGVQTFAPTAWSASKIVELSGWIRRTVHDEHARILVDCGTHAVQIQAEAQAIPYQRHEPGLSAGHFDAGGEYRVCRCDDDRVIAWAGTRAGGQKDGG